MDGAADGERDRESDDAEGAGLAVPPPDVSSTDDPAETDPNVVEAEYRELLDDPKVQVLIARFLSRSEMTAGPVPPPSFLREYEAIRPGAADIVFDQYRLEGQMAAAEQAHRHAVENKLVDNEISQGRLALSEGIKQAKRGQYFGVGLAVLFLAATVFVMWYGMKHDHDWVAAVGGAAIIAEVVGLVYIFARERDDVSREMAQKQQAGSAERASQPEPQLPRQTESGQGSDPQTPQLPAAPDAVRSPSRTNRAEGN